MRRSQSGWLRKCIDLSSIDDGCGFDRVSAGAENRPMSVDAIVQSFRADGRLTPESANTLYVDAPTALLGRLADDVRRAKHPESVVTYIIDRNVNYTNVCVARCKFCAFYRPVGSSEGYTLGFEEIHRKIEETIGLGGGQLLLQGGHNPDVPLQWYEDLFRSVKAKFPAFRLHALSPPEIIHISRLSQLPVPAVIDRLIAAGLDSVPGGGAEILVDRVRKELNCYNKATADEWLDVMRHVHRAGLRTTATMMYGTVETVEERLEHLFRLRDLQDETGGFTAFIAWSYQPQHTELGGTEATGIDYLRTLAIARLVLDNFDNLQSSWVTQGGKVGQLSLAYGANDMGSVMIEENVVRAAGAEYCMDEFEVVRNIESAGYLPKRRNMHYEVLGDPIFREREVPRMLELAVARADGRTGEAADLRGYAARSAAGRRARPSTGSARPEPLEGREEP
jgi:cyclic dehypoxanthinyl futalosine synthase